MGACAAATHRQARQEELAERLRGSLRQQLRRRRLRRRVSDETDARAGGSARALTKACRRSSSERRAGAAASVSAELERLTHSTNASSEAQVTSSSSAGAASLGRAGAALGCAQGGAGADRAFMLAHSACTSCAPIHVGATRQPARELRTKEGGIASARFLEPSVAGRARRAAPGQHWRARRPSQSRARLLSSSYASAASRRASQLRARPWVSASQRLPRRKTPAFASAAPRHGDAGGVVPGGPGGAGRRGRLRG